MGDQNARHSSRYMLVLLTSLLFTGLLACESVEDERLFENSPRSALQISYNGIQTEQGVSLASFTLINDSTESIQYFAYSQALPHYSTEELSDSGWVYLFWNWCGTGADWHLLDPGSMIEFTTPLPDHDCTWRVVLSVVDPGYNTGFSLYSQGLQFTKP